MAQEEILFDDSGVRITTARATIGGKTYAVANLTSVTMSRTPADRRSGRYLIGLAALILLGGLASSSWASALIGVLGLVAGWYVSGLPKDRFHVMLGSASGEGEALVSTNQGFIHGIVDAINEAMVKRG